MLVDVNILKIEVPANKYTGEHHQENDYLYLSGVEYSFVDEIIKKHEPCIDCYGYVAYISHNDEVIEVKIKFYNQTLPADEI
ncbi:MAG: hypothetical protein N2560_06465 [Ignavibacteria bacterium]|nr:hypothetical protein [Ignavibacteria bacterium]